MFLALAISGGQAAADTPKDTLVMAYQIDDIITKPFAYKQGHFEVPNGPGLGVEVDWDKVAKYHDLYMKAGHVNEFYDPWRPNWVPALPIF